MAINKKIKIHLLFVKSGWTIFILCWSINMWGQPTKKQVEKADYYLWGRLHVHELSNKGNWVTYSMLYQEAKDTLFLQNTQNKKTIKIPEGRKSQLIKEEWMVCSVPGDKIAIINLKNLKTQKLENIKSWEVIDNGSQILLRVKKEENEQSVQMLNLKNEELKIWNNCVGAKYNAFNNTIALNQYTKNENKIILIKLYNKAEETRIDVSKTESFSDLSWQVEGENLCYLKGDKTIVYYNATQNKTHEIDLEKTNFFSKNHKITRDGSIPLKISKDGKRVFFGFENKEQKTPKKNPEIWNTKDRWVYPKNSESVGWQNRAKIACWIPENNDAQALTDLELPKGWLTGDQSRMLSYNPMTNEPQFRMNAPIDLYMQTIGEDNKTKIVEKFPINDTGFHQSPSGKFAFYFNEGHWFSYNFEENKHQNLTSTINTSFQIESFDKPDTPGAYGFGGFTQNGEALIYDKFDTWLIAADGSLIKNLTQGRELETIFRLQKQYPENENHNFFNKFEKGVYDLNKGLLFTTEKNTLKGFANWTLNKGIKKWGEQNKRLDQIKKAKDVNIYVYTEEHFNQSPKLIYHNPEKNNFKIIVESNAHQKKYNWGFSKLITYNDSKGNTLTGALYYPAGYNPEKKYPMVVRIYEVFSKNVDQYIIPSDYNTSGFNSANLTTQGFFVLQPDIRYEIGNPGISATDCVLAAVDASIKSASIDSTKIGLMGHSFGGYETLFILTQTNRFATAIASAAISDLRAMYFYVDGTINTPNYWQYEFNQSRMGKSWLDDKKGYTENCPISNAEKINTPLLTWAGLEDRLVHPLQSKSMYLALRRQNKENVMLLYEGETHTLSNRDNQVDATSKVEEWLKHYLQNKDKKEWIKPQN